MASSFRPVRMIDSEEVAANIARPQPAHIEPSLLPCSSDTTSLILSEGITRLATHLSLKQAEKSWTAYVEDCCKIWTIIASLVGPVLPMTPALLAMPGTNGDPFVRGFVYLFLFRLAAAFVSATILEYYFRKVNFRSVRFAMLWYQRVKRCHKSCMDMPWTILASPVITLCWGFVFLALALFSAIWRTGLSPTPLPMEDVNPLVMRLIISLMSVVDLAWIAWLVYTMKNLNHTSQVEPVPEV